MGLELDDLGQRKKKTRANHAGQRLTQLSSSTGSSKEDAPFEGDRKKHPSRERRRKEGGSTYENFPRKLHGAKEYETMQEGEDSEKRVVVHAI